MIVGRESDKDIHSFVEDLFKQHEQEGYEETRSRLRETVDTSEFSDPAINGADYWDEYEDDYEDDLSDDYYDDADIDEPLYDRSTCLYDTIYGRNISIFGNGDLPSETYTRQLRVVSLQTIPAFRGSFEQKLVGVRSANENKSAPGASIHAISYIVALRPLAPTLETGHIAKCKHWELYNHDMHIYEMVSNLQQSQSATFTLAAQTLFRGQVQPVIVGIDLDDDATSGTRRSATIDTRSNLRITTDAIMQLPRQITSALSKLLGL